MSATLPPPAFTGQKHCPHCGQWSGHYQRPEDVCEHCGQVLAPDAVAQEAALEQAWNWEPDPVMLMPINPADPWPLRTLKYLVRGGQLLFAALVSFILWVLAAVAG